MRGKLIVFEGISGTGKETQAKLLQKALLEKGITSHIVYHPNPSLKPILTDLRKNRGISSMTEAYLFLADRHDMVEQVIRPALEKGEWVISLRNYVSALVYQAANEEERVWIAQEFSRFEPPADALFYFSIDPKVAYQRAVDRHNKTGEEMGKFETVERLRQKKEKYGEVIKNIPHIVIDASDSIDEIHSKIRSHLM